MAIVAQTVRIVVPANSYMHIQEVRVWSGGTNVALGGTATQISTFSGASASNAIDGSVSSFPVSYSHTNIAAAPWWQVDLGAETQIDRIEVVNTSFNPERLEGAIIQLKDSGGNTVYSVTLEGTSASATSEFVMPSESGSAGFTGIRGITRRLGT